MAYTVEIAADKDATTWTDLTGAIVRDSLRTGGQAANGEAGSGFGFDLDDDAAAVELPSRRVIRHKIGSTVVARGRVTDKALGRGTAFTGDARQFDVNLSDGNAHLQGIPVHGWERPAETDVARITALCDEFLSGDPRPSTNLAQTYLSAGDPVSMEAHTYDATNPAGVASEVCEASGKLFFVTVDDEIYYDATDSTAYAATLVVTDEAPNLSTEFPPIWDGTAGVQDGTELYSGLTLTFGDPPATIHDSDSAAETAHDYWEEVVNSQATTADQATTELTALVAERSVEEERFTFAVKLTEAQIGLVKYGQTFSFRAAAAGVLTDRTIRVARLEWSTPSIGFWLARIEAGFPKKVAARLSRGTTGPTVPATVSPPVIDYTNSYWSFFLLGLNLMQRLDYVTPGITPKAYQLFLQNTGAAPPPYPGLGQATYRDDQALFISLTHANPGTIHVRGSIVSAGPTPPVIPVLRFRAGLWPDQSLHAYDYAPGTFVGYSTGDIEDIGLVLADGIAVRNSYPLDDHDITLTMGAQSGGRWPLTGSFWTTHRQFVLQTDDARTILFFHVIDSVENPSLYLPASGHLVTNTFLRIADGTTTTDTIPAYQPGTLTVQVGGLPWTDGYTETDPAAGTFFWTQVPLAGASDDENAIWVSYVAA